MSLEYILIIHYDKKIYDSITIDLNTTNESRYDLVGTIRDKKELKWLPIIVHSGKEKSEYRIKSFELGADVFLTKPFNTNKIETQIKITSKKIKLR